MDLDEFRRERDERLLKVALENGYPIPPNLKPGGIPQPDYSPRMTATCIHCAQPFAEGYVSEEVSVCDRCLGD